MEPPSQQKTDKPELTDEYAQSLLRAVTMEHEQKLALKPAQKHFISKKILIMIGVMVVLSIVAAIALDHIGRTN